MICVDTKFFEHVIKCIKIQKDIHLHSLKEKIEWQDKINKTITQCETLLQDVKDEKIISARRRSTYMMPESSLFEGPRFVGMDDVDDDLANTIK